MHYYYKTKVGNTEFIALDKILDNRQFLDFIQIEVDNNEEGFCFDPEWLGISKAIKDYFPTKNQYYNFENFIVSK